LPAGELPARVALGAALTCAAVGLAASLRAAFAGEAGVALLGLTIAALAWTYSAPPVRLVARGLGELDAIAVVAVLVPLIGYVTFAGVPGPHALAATVPGACAMFAMMLAVEIPDARADAATGKRNLVVRWGVASAAIAMRTFSTGAALMLLLVGSATFAAPPVALLLVVAPAAVAAAFAFPQYVAHLPFATLPFLGVTLYALTTCAAIGVVLAAIG
jgi:1,4-dihydroxy-2-naphthoate octaprenyltransferase